MDKPVKSTGRGGKNNFPSTQIPNTEPGENSRYLRHVLATMGLPPIDISDAAQVQERIGWYFNHCADNDMKPTMTGLCNSLGIAKSTLWTWGKGEFRKDTHTEIVQQAYRALEELWESYMLNGKINPVAGIFIGKNSFGDHWQDKQEYVLTPGTTIEQVNPDVIAQKYAELPEE